MADSVPSRDALPAAPDAAWLAVIEAAPWWMRWAAVALLGYSLFLLTPSGTGINQSTIGTTAAAVRLVIEGTALLWAAGRTALPGRLRLSLRIAGWTSLAAAVNYLLLVPQRVGGPTLVPPAVDSVLSLASYVATLWGLLVYPRKPARPGEHAALAIDAVVTVGGLGLLGWLLVTEASTELTADPASVLWIRMFGLSQLAMIVGLNVLIVRGLAVPSARAFWWYVTGQTLYIPVIALTQLAEAGVIDERAADLFYFLGLLPTLMAAVAFRIDPIETGSEGGGPLWLRDLNPLPLAMPLFVGAALLLSLTSGGMARALPLAAALVAISLLLAARLLLSAHRTAALAQAAAAREQRRQADRLQALGRLAGGVAHEFNNLMARVIGNTELGEASLPAGSDARDYFGRARAAAQRAADLTSQLLAFSGQQRTRLEMVDADTLVHETYLRLSRALPAAIVPELQRGGGPCAVFADPAQLRAAMEQIVDNAVEAMPNGGRLVVTVSRETLRQPLVSTLLSAPPGTYVVAAVGDTGSGMTAEAIAVACDPFYSTKPAHLGAGLGLASVHGVVAAHAGGLVIESAPGRGTTVRLYLPAA